MSAFGELWIWDDPALRERLGWYLDVADNRRPAKFLIAATLPAVCDLETDPTDELWHELSRLTPRFIARLEAIREGAALNVPATGPSLLDLVSALAQRMLTACNFCAWDCGVDRAGAAKFGTCKLAAGTRVSSFFHHPGEELVYRGRLGSGTIFFTSCNMRCAFCQNGDISTDKDNGMEVDAATLAAMAWMLRTEGCHNINWVGGDPTIHLHAVLEAIRLLGREEATPDRLDVARAARVKADAMMAGVYGDAPHTHAGRFNAPMLWNSNFFMTEDAMKLLRLVMDVWLPDFKFGPGDCAKRLARTPWYWDTVTRNLKAIHEWGEPYTIRHLIMPNHVDCCTRPVMEWIAEHLPGAPVNIMDQFHPDTFTDPRSPRYRERYEDLSRRPTRDEIRQSYAIARDLGINFETVTFEKTVRGVRLP